LIFEKSDMGRYIEKLKSTYKPNQQVLLIQAPQFLFDSFNIEIAKGRGYYAYPPTGLQCISKVLVHRGFTVDILDLNFELLKRVVHDWAFNPRDWLSILAEYLVENKPSIIGVSGISIATDVHSNSFPYTALLRYLRNEDKHIVIAGGATAANDYEYFLNDDLCHFVVKGEGESRVNYIFDLLYNRNVIRKMDGVFFKSDSRIIESEGGQAVVELHGNLIDTYSNVPIECYNKVGSLNPFSRMAGLETCYGVIQLNRGCRANCLFCGVTDFIGDGLRQYPVQDVIDEIRYLVKDRQVRHFEVLDDDFLGRPDHKPALVVLLKEIIHLREDYEVSWSAGNGLIASSLNHEIMCLIRDSGCIGFRVGIESGNTEMLKRMRKPTSIGVVKRLKSMLRGFPEVFVGGNFILGLFGEETFSQMIDTFKLANSCGLDWASYTTFQFTNKRNTLGGKPEIRQSTDFVPSKDASSREVEMESGVLSGCDIFKLPMDHIPSHEQVKQIWFTFNLVTNYINNPNLLPGGNHTKFTSWVEAVRVSYPDNPYMVLFAGLGCFLGGDTEKARIHLNKTRLLLESSFYWRMRFQEFHLFDVVDNFPIDTGDMFFVLEALRKKISNNGVTIP